MVRYTVRHHGRRADRGRGAGQRAAARSAAGYRAAVPGAAAVTALDGHQAIFAGHNDPQLSAPPGDRDPELQHLELLHRRVRDYAHGRQCAVDAEVRDGEDRAWRLTTTCFPAAEVPLVVPGEVPGLVLDMSALGSPELARNELVRALRPLTSRLPDLAGSSRSSGSPGMRRSRGTPRPASMRWTTARSIADRLDRAIDLLRDNGVAREAFRFANQAMALQRVRSELVRARLADPSASPGTLLRQLEQPRNRSWRPFQLAFVLLCLPGLTDPSHPDARRIGADAPGAAAVLSDRRRQDRGLPRAWPRTRSRSAACRALSVRAIRRGTGHAAWRC